MPSKISARTKRASTAARTSAERDRRAGWRAGVATGAVAALAVVALVWVLADPGRDGEEAGAPVDEFMHIHGLGIAPWAPDDVFVSTHEGLIRIDEKGDWWLVSEQRHDFMGFATHPTDEGVLYTSGHPAPDSGLENPVGFMASEDAGATWTPRSLHGQVDFHAMAVQPTDGNVVYGWFADRLFRSFDGGENWDVLEAPALTEAGGALSLAVHPQDPGEVIAATQVALLRLRDDGHDREAILEAPTTAVTFAGTDPEHLIAYVPSPGPGLVESTDGGQTWEELGFVLDDDVIGHLAVRPDDPEILYVGSYGESLFRSRDGGATWEQLATDGVPQ